MNKKISIYILLSCIFISTLFSQESVVQSVQVMGKYQGDNIVLRWAANTPLAWKKGNSYGFMVERTTISRNGEAVLPLEKIILTPSPLKPSPLENWETIANNDQNAAILAQALYGDSFFVQPPKGNGIEAIYALSDELEQRFTFSLLAAEQNFDAALLAGWGLVDTSIRVGEVYLYKVSIAIPKEKEYTIEDGAISISTLENFELPKPIDFTGVFDDGRVLLSWNYQLLQQVYSNYWVERSEDNIQFERLNRAPIFNAQSEEKEKELSLYYVDSIPNNKKFYYRIKAKTPFGEISPSSEIVSGMGLKKMEYSPRISGKYLPNDSTVELEWEFKEKGNELISGFELRRGLKDDGPFETVKENIAPTKRSISYTGLKRINYFVIVAKGKNGMESESFPVLVQPVDSIPPIAPQQLSGTVDTTGVVSIRWKENEEEDLRGYRVFRSYHPDQEYSEITNTELKSSHFRDTLQIKALNKTIYYKVKAEDQRYNRSSFSEVLTLVLPDVVPPSPPVLANYQVSENGVILNWIPSSSEDVTSHVLYRKRENSKENMWEPLIETVSDTTYTDNVNLERGVYQYTIIARDSSELESSPAPPIRVVWNGTSISNEDMKLSAIANRELRFIHLSWNIKTEAISFRLYRGTKEKAFSLYKTIDGSTKTYNDADLQINTEYTYAIQGILPGGILTSLKEINVKY